MRLGHASCCKGVGRILYVYVYALDALSSFLPESPFPSAKVRCVMHGLGKCEVWMVWCLLCTCGCINQNQPYFCLVKVEGGEGKGQIPHHLHHQTGSHQWGEKCQIIFVCACVCVCMCVYIFVCMYLFMMLLHHRCPLVSIVYPSACVCVRQVICVSTHTHTCTHLHTKPKK